MGEESRMAGGTDENDPPRKRETTGAAGQENTVATREENENGTNSRPPEGRDAEMMVDREKWTNISSTTKTIWTASTTEPNDKRVVDSNETEELEDQNSIENDGTGTGQNTRPPRADEMTVGSDALSLPRSDEEKLHEEDLTIERMTYFVPCRVDLLKTSWNPDANPEKWIKKIFAIVKNADKSVALLAQ